MGDDSDVGACDTNLALGITIGARTLCRTRDDINVKSHSFNLNLSLSLYHSYHDGEVIFIDEKGKNSASMTNSEDGNLTSKNSSSSNKDDVYVINGNNGVRKKLKLTREQSSLLEESFNRHSTLSKAQKQGLAVKLNLQPRQVEVWFQNRRARTKLKQIENDCEFLKKYHETLTEDNRRLQRELQELRSLNFEQQPPPNFLQLSKAVKLTCASCEKSTKARENISRKHETAALNVVTKPNEDKII